MDKAKLIETIESKRGIFTQHGGRWVVIGPAYWYEGGTARIVKEDGSEVIVRTHNVAHFSGAVEYAIADYTIERQSSYCSHGDVSNTGQCYSCGRYVRREDAGLAVRRAAGH